MVSSRNVGLTFAYRISDGLASGIWSSAVLSTYVSVLMGSDDAANEKVGIAQAVQGLFLVSAALPAGWLASRMRKASILRMLAVVQLAAIVLTSYVLLDHSWSRDGKFLALCAALALWGIAQGNSPVVDALFADSVPTGSRSRLYSWLHIGNVLSQGLGPAIAAATFHFTVDDWEIEIMQQVMLLGMVAALVPTALLLFFDDNAALGAASDSVHRIMARQRAAEQQERERQQEAAGGMVLAGKEGLEQPLLAETAEEDDVEKCAEAEVEGQWNEDEEQNLEGFDLNSTSPSIQALPHSTDPSPSPVRPVGLAGAGPSDSGQSGDSQLGAEGAEAADLVDSHAIDISDTLSMSSRSSSLASGHARFMGNLYGGEIARMPPVQEDSPATSPSKMGDTAPPAPLVRAPSGRTAALMWSAGLEASAMGLPTKEALAAAAMPASTSAPWDGGRAPSFQHMVSSEPSFMDMAGNQQRIITLSGYADESSGDLPSMGLSHAGSGRSSFRRLGSWGLSLKPPSRISSSNSTASTVKLFHAGLFGCPQPMAQPQQAQQQQQQQQPEPEQEPERPHYTTRQLVTPDYQHVEDDGDSDTTIGAEDRSESVVGSPRRTASGRPIGSRRRARREAARMLSERFGSDGCGCCVLSMAWIPALLAATDCVMGLASGMTIKFFPIFFKTEVGLAPTGVTLMYCAIPLVLSTLTHIAQRGSCVIGRVQTMVINRAIGISLLYWIAWHVDSWTDPRTMVPIYIIRTSIMNCNYPLQKSILMDFVDKEHRAKWNSFEAVTSFGWSGSAALGGWLIKNYGFQVTFYLTASLQLIGWACSLLLLPLVPTREVLHHSLACARPSRRVSRNRNRLASP